ncbi:MAG: hypothetical protein WC917_02610 [Bacilli bacterium]|jgi:hypothetical protein
MDFESFKIESEKLKKSYNESSKLYSDFCALYSNEIGLTDDMAKNTPQYKKLKANYDRDFQAYRKFNSENQKNIKLYHKLKHNKKCIY